MISLSSNDYLTKSAGRHESSQSQIGAFKCNPAITLRYLIANREIERLHYSIHAKSRETS